MTKRMLIDATHAEETRVAIVSGNKLEEFDYESATRKQLKGSIFLVKVTRVEPSLQAAFVDFGGNRHGFLPFPEIHTDYYRIPIEDREALLAEQRALLEQQTAEEEARDKAAAAAAGLSEEDLMVDEEETGEDFEDAESQDGEEAQDEESQDEEEDQEEDQEDEEEEEEPSEETSEEPGPSEEENEQDGTEEDQAPSADIVETPAPAGSGKVETVGGDDAASEEESPKRRWMNIKRRYKIQEVIKRSQIMLIQVTKEERGNKGAAVTTYISLPGRYCVLMPNSPRGGGVSRKVGNVKDRQRLKQIMAGLDVPEGMSVIIRTAGISRSKAEIKRDLDYLLRLWDEIREQTMKSTAPALIYEEGNLIKRAIRDLYKREIDEVLIAGEEGFKSARDFMKTLMPSHVKRVVQYTDETIPLFFRYQVESQVDEIHNNTVQLRSGGYIVINPTEALVSIDVNSGRATRERHIEETALKTNMEAAEEIARQLRLRDLGGLIVIDFIDMEDYRNNRSVERRLKEAMSNDRARIQLGRISAFGLLELSRQRLRPSLVESHFEPCTHCAGHGIVRTVESTSVMILRVVEEESMRLREGELRIAVPTAVATYIFNHKRAMIEDIERRHTIKIFIDTDDTLIKPDYRLDKGSSAHQQRAAAAKQIRQQRPPADSDSGEGSESGEGKRHGHSSHSENRGENRGDGGRRGGRRGGRGRDRGRHGGGENREHNKRPAEHQHQPRPESEGTAPIEAGAEENFAPAGEREHVEHPRGGGDDQQRRRRRGRRGGRRRGRNRHENRQGGEPQQQGRDFGSGDQPDISKAYDAPSSPPSQPQERAPAEHRPARNAQQDNTAKNFSEPSAPSAEGSSDQPKRKGWWQKFKE